MDFLLGLLSSRNVDSILRSINSLVRKLEAHAKKQEVKAAKKSAEVTKMLDKIAAGRKEAERAQLVAARLGNLIS
jgi:hypothetical protein